MQEKSETAITQLSTHARFTPSMLPRRVASLALVLGAFVFGGCFAQDKLEVDPDRPGGSVIAGIIACKKESDCKSGETCDDGFCQMKRCSDTYQSTPPLGQVGYAFVDRAFVTASADTAIRAFSPSTTAERSQSTVSAPPLDIAGGNLTGKRPESFAVLTEGSRSVQIVTRGSGAKPIDVGFQGTHVATGDVTGDGIDEIVVADDGGAFAVCDGVRGTCTSGNVSRSVSDVAVGDVDGDGLGEILLLGANTLTVVNASTRTVTKSYPVKPNLVNISAGDLDGDGKAEILGTELGDNTSYDRLYVFRLNEQLAEDASIKLGYTVWNDALDVAYAKLDNKPVIGVLSNASTLQMFEYANRSLVKTSEAAMPNGNARRLAAADVNGRSASVRLKTGPHLEVGPAVPIAVLTLPPYSATYSMGPSSATMGATEEDSTAASQGTSKTTSVSLMLGGGVSIPLGGRGANTGDTNAPATIPGPNGKPMPNPNKKSGGAMGLSLSGFVTQTWSNTVSRSLTKSVNRSIGNSYTITAEPQIDGWNSGGVVLAGGCFHRYDYAIDDPHGVLETEALEVSTHVPVGGESSLWSTRRYNALVDAIADGRLPKIAIPSKIGNVSSYPKAPVTLDGKPIPKADNVFPRAPISRSSDVGSVSFSLTSSDSTTNTDATAYYYSTGLSASANANTPFAHFNVQGTEDINEGLDQSYSVTLGTSASFSGQIYPVRDDPTTPANEASVHGYSFRPVVYRHYFKGKNGQKGAYYVLTYAAGK